MQVQASQIIQVQAVLEIQTTQFPTQVYAGAPFSFIISWTTPYLIYPEFYIVTVGFGDGTSTEYSSDAPDLFVSGSHTYTLPGTYTVSISITGMYSGITGATTTTVTTVEELTVSLTASPTSGTAPLTVSFNGTMSGGFTPYSWTLDFGDGSAIQSGTTPSLTLNHTYETAGTFTAVLTVEDSLGTLTQLSLPVAPQRLQTTGQKLILAAVGVATILLLLTGVMRKS